jgi:hypothetical protein
MYFRFDRRFCSESCRTTFAWAHHQTEAPLVEDIRFQPLVAQSAATLDYRPLVPSGVLHGSASLSALSGSALWRRVDFSRPATADGGEGSNDIEEGAAAYPGWSAEAAEEEERLQFAALNSNEAEEGWRPGESVNGIVEEQPCCVIV